MLSGMGYPTGKKPVRVHVWVKLESCGYEFFYGRVGVGGCEYGTVLPDGFLLIAISNPHRQDTSSLTSGRFARVLSASHDNSLPRLQLLVHTSSLRLRLLVRTSNFRLRPRWGPHTEVGVWDRGTHTNVALPRRTNFPATTRKAPILHVVQAPQLAGRVGGRL
jgi:hypothetical protein